MQRLKRYGRRLDLEIAAEMRVPLATVRKRLAELGAAGDVLMCHLTRYEGTCRGDAARFPVVMFGEGVATKRRDLVQEFGDRRIRNTPLAEGVIAGTAAGAAANGLRPVIDLLFAPFLCFTMEELINGAGKLRYISGGQFSFPLVAMAMADS